ncbi:hypothetical protein ASPWEDRAFT_39180 [Aspergillus wentii DTO 134E9]|uniref:Protein kinase domain-containing protein n=1 Tax=Aspergillus wentii DTO 134E9 TaxID=1073089 RepID=A0A1L9RR94_ASPWE|nr:uncharacterized protein ASPWEDRAFT_39180 [Aspergillus wentii DTO 134E9]OJJ37486.1 hypothetical protein ASPWEDRAFT_39180 [Aspergillus wentii DTO 134E9]
MHRIRPRHISRTLHSLSRKPLTLPPPTLLPQHELIDEEISPGYNPKTFYPANPGDVLADRYQILVKVGWGMSSTVWFARDMRGHEDEPENVIALKITNTTSHAADEREIEDHIATTDASHRGRSLFRTYSDCFEIAGPEGKHVCLAYEPMREPMWLFKKRFRNGVIPLPLVKTYVYFLLVALDYLHAGCGVVHTGLFLFEDADVLGDFMNHHLDHPMQYKIDSTGRPIYLSQNDFGPLQKVTRNIPKLVDFGLSNRLDSHDDWGIHPIQPDHYRAPEVILGCGWRMSADIWNLGVLVWEIIVGRGLFCHVHDGKGCYDARAHLGEMIALFGLPPIEMVTRYHSARGYKWRSPIKRQDGKVCEDAEQYFGGPFFYRDGNFLHSDLIPDRKLDTLPLEEEERENFLSFIKMTLAWVPEDRKTARELMEHPFVRR